MCNPITPTPCSSVVDCGPLENPGNGTVTVGNTTFGSEALYSCDEGYGIVGNVSRVCQDNQEWSGSAPECGKCVYIIVKCQDQRN